jgi:hypothetical protein
LRSKRGSGVKFKAAAIALALGMTAFAGGASATAADKEIIGAGSETALVIIKSDYWQPAPSMKSMKSFKLALSRFDATEQKLLGGPFSGLLIEARKKNFADGYLVKSIKPGRWTFVSYSQQDKWALCFNARSHQFEVKAGEVIYLGALDAISHRGQLAEQAVRSGKVMIRSDAFADFFDLPEGPQLTPIDESQLADVRAMLARHAPHVTGPVRGAEYSPAQFGTGSTLFGQRRCGGYFTTGVKKKGQAAN